jgi:hypothetical protein
MEIFNYITALPSIIIRYGILFPLRFVSLGASTLAFFVTLPIGLTLKSSSLVVNINIARSVKLKFDRPFLSFSNSRLQ